jgi:hypothetical protein
MTDHPPIQPTTLGKYLVGSSFRKAKGVKGKLPEANSWRVLAKESKGTPTERAQKLATKFKKEADDEMSKGIIVGPKVRKSVKMVGLLARIKARAEYKSQKSKDV